jgi:putative hemolysin
MIAEQKSSKRTAINRSLLAFARPLIERTLHRRRFHDLCESARLRYTAHPAGPGLGSWCEALLQAAGLQPGRAQLPPNFQVPAGGSLLVASNQPFGILDACLAGRFLAGYRRDTRLLGPAFLMEMPELADWLLPYDARGGVDAWRINQDSLARAREHLCAGGSLLVFPSEDVAQWRPGRGIVEGRWGQHVGRLVRQTGCPVLPLFLSGRNSAVFHTAGIFHSGLRRTLMAREFCRANRLVSTLRAGPVIPNAKLKKFGDDAGLANYLRLHSLVLGGRGTQPLAATDVLADRVEPGAVPVAGRAPKLRAAMIEEVERLKESGAALAAAGNFSVIVATAEQIPALLQEIGRQREIAFRMAGEGTGREIDLDPFDSYYLHLFLWAEDRRELAGAYRMGLADEILKRHGRAGLYTSTLFKFRRPFLGHLRDAVEMGRSFIVPGYQRSPACLAMLWKGISIWVARNPRYRKLFGPVSISQDYHNLSRNMLVEFLKDNLMNGDLASHVRPRQPFKSGANRKLMREFISASLDDIEDCSALISSLETDQKGIPVLLKHYLRLNGTLLSFNVDKEFSSVVDGLTLVDLTRTDPRLLSKYMGERQCREYLAHHGISLPESS